ncbi:MULTISPECIES: NUDIX hydrolase [Chryseobacterium group]|uniref:NUDIX hydrolase n=1 Tax=Chryseobacterium group TaxID=2782232 RepID=UPI0012AA7214|nr:MULTISPECIES: NUDIX domain-containing protein [Chryseobacterium group]MDF0719006.1 NUDIX domain-containing protein [Kaistella sp. PBT33-4]QFG54180.1 NUDIX domain-containing protein [Chryseobacterium sp.]
MNASLKYCPNCGTETLEWTEDKKWSCDCGFVLYHNVASAVAVIIRHGNELLFTRRNREPQKGKLDMAGGFVDPHESAEDTCCRELFEELGLLIDISRLKYLASLPNIYRFKDISYNTLDLFYEYEVDEKFQVELELSEISETLWIDRTKIDLEELAFESQRKFLWDYLR